MKENPPVIEGRGGISSARVTSESGKASIAGDSTVVVDAYADGEIWWFCTHERRWHATIADRARHSDCHCPRSPFLGREILAVVVGELTADVCDLYGVAPDEELPACSDCWQSRYDTCLEPGCAHVTCSCQQTRCPIDGFCATHSDPNCADCWRLFASPGELLCRVHGFLPGHPHRCAPEECPEMPGNVMLYWPRPGEGYPHVHCPGCMAAEALWRYRRGYPKAGDFCAGCVASLSDEQLARLPDWASV